MGEESHGAPSQATPTDWLSGTCRGEEQEIYGANPCQSVHWAGNLVSEAPPIAGNSRKTFQALCAWKASGWWPFQAVTAGKPGGTDFHRDRCCVRRHQTTAKGKLEYVLSNIYKTDDLRNSPVRRFHCMHFPNQDFSDTYNKQFLLFRPSAWELGLPPAHFPHVQIGLKKSTAAKQE